MAQILFQNDNDISNDWLFYIENEAKSLAQRDDFAIRNYLDREIFNPEIQSYLAQENVAALFNAVNETETLHLNLTEGMKSNFLPDWLSPRFLELKAKVKQIFCSVVHGIGELDAKDIIKAVLVALIPAFLTGVPAAILPILIGLIAYLLKYGIDKTCPG
jgi:hypothetical protein